MVVQLLLLSRIDSHICCATQRATQRATQLLAAAFASLTLRIEALLALLIRMLSAHGAQLSMPRVFTAARRLGINPARRVAGQWDPSEPRTST